MVPVARRNLLAEKGRLAMSVAGVAFALLLVLIIVSLYRGWSGASAVFEQLPGDLWVAQAGTTDPFRATSLIPAESVDEVAAIPGVLAAWPVYARRIGFDHAGKDLDVFFLSIGAPQAAVPAAQRERFLPASGHVIVDSVLAGSAGLEAGDGITVLGEQLVVESVRPGGNPIFELAFLNTEQGATLLGYEGTVSFVLASLDPRADPAEVSTAIQNAVSGSDVRTSAEFADAMGDLVNQGFLPVVGVLVALGLVIGGAVIALTAYTATIEKARDFGVLKAVGASNAFVYRIVVTQSLIVGLLGSSLGLGAAALAATLIKRGVPEFVTDLRVADAAVLFGAAVLVSILAAYVPVHRINRIDPAIVFRA